MINYCLRGYLMCLIHMMHHLIWRRPRQDEAEAVHISLLSAALSTTCHKGNNILINLDGIAVNIFFTMLGPTWCQQW